MSDPIVIREGVVQAAARNAMAAGESLETTIFRLAFQLAGYVLAPEILQNLRCTRVGAHDTRFGVDGVSPGFMGSIAVDRTLRFGVYEYHCAIQDCRFAAPRRGASPVRFMDISMVPIPANDIPPFRPAETNDNADVVPLVEPQRILRDIDI